jgi:hypothetical protein
MRRSSSVDSIAETIESYDNVMSFADDTFSLQFDESSALNGDGDENSLQDSKAFDRSESKSDDDNDDDSDISTVRCEVNNLVARETRHIKRLRRIMKIVILLASIGTFYLILSVNKSKEDDKFNNAYHTFSTVLLNDFQNTFQQRLKAMISVKTMIESYVTDNQQQIWPFVTVPSLHQRANSIMDLTGSSLFTYGPFVTDYDIFTWGQYSIQQQSDTFTITSNYSNQSIHYFDTDSDIIIDAGPGPYLVRAYFWVLVF